MPGDTGNQVVLSDLDSTIADTTHRHHLIPTYDGTSDWNKYALACAADQPIMSTITALRLLAVAGHPVHIVSGRADVALDMTHIWLARHDVPYRELRLFRHLPEQLRVHGDSSLAGNIAHKTGYIRELRDRGLDVALYFDDSEHVARRIETETGVPTVLVRTPSSVGELREWREGTKGSTDVHAGGYR